VDRSKKATIVLTVLIGFQFTFTAVNQVTTSSRQLWAFARDKGVPFHRTLSKVGIDMQLCMLAAESTPRAIVNALQVTERDGLPRNALIVTLGSTVVLCCIIIGSTTAYVPLHNLPLRISYSLTQSQLQQHRLPLQRFPGRELHVLHRHPDR